MPAFDQTKYFSQVTPPDNGVAYVQNGRPYNASFQELDDDGKVIAAAPVPAKPNSAAEVKLSPAEVLMQADSIPFLAFKAKAKLILGDACPGSKADIICALERVSGVRPAPEPLPAPKVNQSEPVKLTGGLEVDLLAWGRKTDPKHYLFGDVTKAFRLKYNKQIDNERDGINFLIDEGAIPAAEARNV
jgi:hypothetical protein